MIPAEPRTRSMVGVCPTMPSVFTSLPGLGTLANGSSWAETGGSVNVTTSYRPGYGGLGERTSVRRLGSHQPGGGPVPGHRGGRGRGQPRDGCRLGHVGGVDGTRAPHLRGQQPDRATVHQVGEGVHERVDEVAVVLAPPQQDGVDHIAVVAVDHVGIDRVLDLHADRVVDVLVPPELLDHHAVLQTEPLPGVLGGGGAFGTTRGRAHVTPPHLVLVLAARPGAGPPPALVARSPPEVAPVRKAP